VAAVLLVGLHRFKKLAKLGRSPAEIETNVTKAMGDYVPHVMEVLEKRLWILSMVATISPLLGMTGTVTGMIRSFTAMSAMGGLEGNVVAAGISEALVTTATGLLIAMPAALFYHIFSRKVEQYVLEIEESGTKLIDFITLEHGAEKASR
jgi:biopolymer transport protein ExbB